MKVHLGNSLAVQWLGLHAFSAVGLGSTLGRVTKMLKATQHSSPKKRKYISLIYECI